MTRLADMVRAFVREEDGIALTEYLILLGVLTAAVIAAVLLAGGNLANAWNGWAVWFETLDNNVPTVAAGGGGTYIQEEASKAPLPPLLRLVRNKGFLQWA